MSEEKVKPPSFAAFIILLAWGVVIAFALGALIAVFLTPILYALKLSRGG